MRKFITYLAFIAIICCFSNQSKAQNGHSDASTNSENPPMLPGLVDGYTYTLIDNGSFSYTIAAVPNASTSNFSTSMQSYGFTIILPDGVTATITSSIGSGAGATFFDGSAVGQSTIDGYLITETLGGPISLPEPANGTASPMVTIQLNETPTSGTISILENDSALATTVIPLKSFMSADMVDDGMAIFVPVVDADDSGVSGDSSFTFTTLSTPDIEVIDFSIYPNPTTDNLYINQINNLTKVEIINMNGQLVLTKENNLEKVNVSRLHSGMYFLKVYTENGSSSKKFIKK